MKRITTILSLITMMLVSAITYADDINLFLNNRADSTDASTKPQVLFLIDLVMDSPDDTDPCPDWPDPVLDNDGSGDTGNCSSAVALPTEEYQASGNIRGKQDVKRVQQFKGSLCEFGAGVKYTGQTVTRTCRSGGKYVDSRPLIAEVMRQRPDAKFGVMTLKVENDDPATTSTVEPTVRSAGLVLEVKARTEAEVKTAIEYLNTESNVTKIDGSSVPTTGGLAKVYEYLHNDIASKTSPLIAGCENLHLVMITNGGWKDDATPSVTSLDDIAGVAAPDTTSSAFLQQIAAKFRDNSAAGTGCDAKISTSVIGLNVATDNATEYPLFKITDTTSPAMEMAKVGQGVYLNTTDGKTIVNEVLGLLDFSYPDPSALISPSSPVSVSRSHNLSLLFASAFKPEGKIAWPGNMTMGTVAEWTASGMDPTKFDVDLNSTDTSTDIAGLSGITIKTDLCASDATALCTLSDTNSTILTSDDVAWLAGSTLDNNDVFGDPIHFKTLAIHYGDINGDGDKGDHDDDEMTEDVYMATPDPGELYVLVGTNRGLLHMFDYAAGGTLTHKWAFFPKELERMIPALRNGNLAPSYNMVNHFYGVDGAPSIFLYDQDKDGKIIKTDPVKDRALLYFGLRRGGATYYALDITAPADPKLLWSKGKATADYGTKPEAEVGSGDGDRTWPETKDIPSYQGGPCPRFHGHANDGILSSNALNVCSFNSTKYCLNPSISSYYTDEEETQSYLTSWSGDGVYSGGLIYYKGESSDVITPTGRDDRPVFTHKSQCAINLPDEGTHTFEANMLGTGPIAKGGTIYECNGVNLLDNLRAAMGVGVKNLTYESIIGFDLSSLPDNVYITSAKLTFSHADNDVDTSVDVTPSALYDEGISLYAAKDGIYGNAPHRQMYLGGTCMDWDDNEHYTNIAEIGSPVDDNYTMGSRTTEGNIFGPKIHSHLYTGGSTKHIDALTKLFNSNVTQEDRINDSNHNLAWAQFKVRARDPAQGFVGWVFPQPGELVSNWEYNTTYATDEDGDLKTDADGKLEIVDTKVPGDGGFVDYWDMVVPKLTLTWTKTAPSDVASDGDMSIDDDTFKTCVVDDICGSSPIQLTLNITGTGSVSVNNDDVVTTCSDSSPGGQCTITATAESIVLSVVGDGSTFSGWSGCDSDGAATTCTMNMTESKTLTASFTTVTTSDLYITTKDTNDGAVSVTVDGQIISFLNGPVAVVQGAAVAATASANGGPAFSKWLNTSTCTIVNPCEFLMPATDITGKAEFGSTATLSLTVNGAANGTVATSLNGSGIDCSSGCTEAGEYTIEFTPAEGYVIGSIAGCQGAPGCTLTRTLDADNSTIELSADFQKAEYTVTVTADPSDGGTISVSPASIEHNTKATISVDPGTNTITGVTSSGCTVTKVSDDTSTIETYETSAITNNDCQVTATFAAGSSCDVLSPEKTCSGIFGLVTSDKTPQTLAGCTYSWVPLGTSQTYGWHGYNCINEQKGVACYFEHGAGSGNVTTDETYTHEKDSKYYKSDACSQ